MNRLTRYSGGRDVLSQLHNDFDRLLTPFNLRSEFGLPEAPMSDWIPSIDVRDETNRFVLHADVPGVEADDIEINMENGLLTIRGKRGSEEKEEGRNFLRVERSSGSFMRRLSLPETVDSDKIQAKCRGGVLELILPKADDHAGRRIKVSEA